MSKAEYMKEYRKDSEVLEKHRAANREYAAGHREEANSRSKEWYQSNKAKVAKREAIRRLNFKRKCLDVCGSMTCIRCDQDHPAALDFHHRDRQAKEFRISDMISKPWEVVLIELAKYDVLCKNCHAIEHCTWELA